MAGERVKKIGAMTATRRRIFCTHIHQGNRKRCENSLPTVRAAAQREIMYEDVDVDLAM